MIAEYWNDIEFAYPQILFLLFGIPALVIWYVKASHRTQASMKVSSLKSFHNSAGWRRNFRHLVFICRIFTFIFLIMALARPQVSYEKRRMEGNGIDIVLCIDVSGSMLAQDFSPNRLEAAKEVAANFVTMRPADRIGLVVFAGESFTQCPVTSDHQMLLYQVNAIRGGFMVDGTAIGSGLATSADRLRTSTTQSRIIVLLTDGENNGGLVDPLTAKEIVKSLGIKVYTIGIGTEGIAPTPVQTPAGKVIMQQERVNIDEKLLTAIAAETGGRYYRAKDKQGLMKIYADIDKLEKSKVEINTSRRYTEKFQPLALLAFFFLMCEMLLKYFLFKKFP